MNDISRSHNLHILFVLTLLHFECAVQFKGSIVKKCTTASSELCELSYLIMQHTWLLSLIMVGKLALNKEAPKVVKLS